MKTPSRFRAVSALMLSGLRRRMKGGLKAFTVIELMVSMTVLTVLMLMVTQVVDGTTSVIGRSGKHMDSDAEARLLFNRLAVDLAQAVKRTDVDYSSFKQPAGKLGARYSGATIPANLQSGNDQMAFYSETDGYFSGSRLPNGSEKNALALVAYTLDRDPYTNQPGLLRLGKGLGWEPDSSGAWSGVAYLPQTLSQQYPGILSTDPDYKNVGSQVVRFEYTYLLKASGSQPARLSTTPWDTTTTPAHTSIDGFRDVAAIVVAMVVLDSTSRAMVTDYSGLTGNSVFPDATDGTDLAAMWNAKVNSPTFAQEAGIPAKAASGVRVYQRYFYLDTLQP